MPHVIYHLETTINTFPTSVDRNTFYARLQCYHMYKMHLHKLPLFKECLITWDISMLVPYALHCSKAIIFTFQMSADRKHFYPRLFWYYRYNMALWKSIHSKEWLITLDIFKLIDYAASHFKALLNAFNMTAHRKCFYLRSLDRYW